MKRGGAVRRILSILVSVGVVAFCWFGVWRLMDEITDSDGMIPQGPQQPWSGSAGTHGTGTQTPGVPGQTGDSEDEPEPEGQGRPEEPFVPTQAEVLALRKQVTEGMTDEDKAALRDAVVNANLSLESKYFYDNFFEKLKDPESLYWNYFEKTGEIQIGWAESSDGTKTEVMDTNSYSVEDYVERLGRLKKTVVSGLLDEDFDRLAELLTTAKRDHDGDAVEEFYHMFHDLDYFLMRYGETDVGPYVQDKSTVTLYYGALAVWKNGAEGANQAY